MVIQVGNSVFPYTFDQEKCDEYSAIIIDDLITAAADLSPQVAIATPTKQCSPTVIKVCTTFFSDEEGARLQSFIDTQKSFWINLITGGGCPAFLIDHTILVTVGGSGGTPAAPSEACLSGVETAACAPETVDFPKCKCATKPGVTPFAARPVMTEKAGRTSGTTAFCFEIDVVTPNNPGSSCGKTTVLHKMEFWANDNQRRKLTGLGVQPAGGVMTYISASWGTVGEETLKATPLNWSIAQSNGAVVCLELDNSTDLSTFCMGPSDNTCWLNLFDNAKDCCPLYSASVV